MYRIDTDLKVNVPPNLTMLFQKEFASITADEAKFTASELQKNLYGQKYRMRRLSRTYAAAKLRRGLDRRILIATGDYVNSICAQKIKDGNGHTSYYVGPRPGAHKGSNIDRQMLGLWLEYGTPRMPARPHYRPEMARMTVRLQKRATVALRALAAAARTTAR